MKCSLVMIALIPFYFSTAHGMEDKPEFRFLSEDMLKTATEGSYDLTTLSTNALNSFVDTLHTGENIIKCQTACRKFYEKGFPVQRSSATLSELLHKDWEKQYPRNYGLVKAAHKAWKTEVEDSLHIVQSDGEQLVKHYAAATEIKTILAWAHKQANK